MCEYIRSLYKMHYEHTTLNLLSKIKLYTKRKCKNPVCMAAITPEDILEKLAL